MKTKRIRVAYLYKVIVIIELCKCVILFASETKHAHMVFEHVIYVIYVAFYPVSLDRIPANRLGTLIIH